MPSSQMLLGDCREQLQSILPDSIDAIVTDPPYELGFMGKGWDRSGIAYDPQVWGECLRVLKPGGYVLAFGGTRTFHRLTCAIEDAGFEIRDVLSWLYGTGFPKNSSTALKPAWEPVVMARKPFKGSLKVNLEAHGTGALNIDVCRIEYLSETDKASATPQGACTSKESAAVGAEPDAGRNLARVEFERPELKGRFPANVLLDSEAAELLDEQTASLKSGGNLSGSEPSSRTKNVYGESLEREPWESYGDSGGASRFFYCAKASKSERNAGVEKNTHPTVKPVDLMGWLIRLVTPLGGTVLDPFAGSGSTGVAALCEGRSFIGIDLTPEYVAIAEGRIRHAARAQ